MTAPLISETSGGITTTLVSGMLTNSANAPGRPGDSQLLQIGALVRVTRFAVLAQRHTRLAVAVQDLVGNHFVAGLALGDILPDGFHGSVELMSEDLG